MSPSTRRRSEFWLAVERSLNTTRNWNQTRPYTASLSERTEGFTERFGDANVDPSAECWRKEMQSIESICATEHPPQPIRLVQYRPAWLEQLALRISGLPHVVINSPYAVTEGTGPLPFLQDLGADHMR